MLPAHVNERRVNVNRGGWSSSSRRLVLVFLAVLVPAAVTLVWLGIRLLAEDRALLAQRRVERQEATADNVVREWSQFFTEADLLLAGNAGLDGALRVDITAEGLAATPRQRLLWVAAMPPLPEAATDPFATAEALEFGGLRAEALLEYQQFAASRHAQLRAGALLRVARVHRQGGYHDAAVTAYQQLAQIRDVAVDGMPVDLLARRAACDLLSKAGRDHEAQERARAIEADLLAGRWALDRSGWEISVKQVETWTRRSMQVPPVNIALSAAVDWLSDAASRDALPLTGRRLLRLENVPLTVIWRRDNSGTSAFVLPPEALTRWWQRAVPSLARGVSLTDGDTGEAIMGEQSRGDGVVQRPASATGLPWTMAVTMVDPSGMTSDFATRRRLLGLGFGAIVLLLVGGSYLLWRIVQRELAVAQLQAEFVSAVSHEFRTPLTSLTHVAELLQEEEDTPREQRQAFYQILSRNTERLHHLVESLLDFARMEAGRKPYDLRPIDAAAFVTKISEEFRQDAASRGVAVHIDIAAETAAVVEADAAALGHALWNLLDNAVKYSPDRAVIDVALRKNARGVRIAVRDRGLGIPRQERADIFAKFVRGEQARRRGIKGTGVGLAIVAHIVEAHGGAIELSSEEGKGSTFTVVLPAAS